MRRPRDAEVQGNRQILQRQLQHYVKQMRASPPDLTISPVSHKETVLTLLSRCQALDEMESYVSLLEAFGAGLQKNSHMGLLDHHLETGLALSTLSNAQRVELASLRIRLLVQRGDHHLAQQVLESAWPSADTPQLRAELYNREGVLREVQGDYWASQQRHEQALQLAQPHGELALVAVIYNNLGNWAYKQDRYEEAIDYYMNALEAAEQIDNPGYSAPPEGGLGMTLDELGEYEEARQYHVAARGHYEQAGNMLGLVRTDLNMSYAALEQGNVAEAKELAGRALRLAQQLGDLHREASAWHNLGRAYHLEKNYEAAVECLLKALEKRRWLGEALYEQGTLKRIKEVAEALAEDERLEPERRDYLLRQCREVYRDFEHREPAEGEALESTTWAGRSEAVRGERDGSPLLAPASGEGSDPAYSLMGDGGDPDHG